ncbi:MAG: PKD domain-containing protein [Bacteroidales bacterium]|nr:PKD domain-containing protein [Bacteroidales bacterium]
MRLFKLLLGVLLLSGSTAIIAQPVNIYAQDKSGTDTSVQVTEPGFKVFQFPRLAIPRIDGEFSDWDMVPDSYIVPTEEMWDDSRKHKGINKSTLDIKVKVGWVEGLNRLYFYYEAYDDYWDFDQLGLRNDTFEIVVDGDLSGGPHVDEFRLNSEVLSRFDAFFTLQNVHAQNYHIMTPPTPGKSWTMAWGVQQWLKELPYANYAYSYDFKHGEAGTLKFEFYITPFDHASPDGPQFSTESKLYEGKKIGLCWAVIDYDGGRGNNGFWNLSPHHRMFGNASMQRLFTLMPLEENLRKPVEAAWTHTVIDNSRVVAFRDKSHGNITSWKWDFGDGTTSTEQNPVHEYARDNARYVVTLYVEGPDGKDLCCKIWDVAVRDTKNPSGQYE